MKIPALILGAILLFLVVFNYNHPCPSGYGYIEECLECQERGKGYSVCSGFCLDNCDGKGCSVTNHSCCYTEIIFESATGTQCVYNWGVFEYLWEKRKFDRWTEEMAEREC